MNSASIVPASHHIRETVDNINNGIDTDNGISVMNNNHAGVCNDIFTSKSHRKYDNPQVEVFALDGNTDYMQLCLAHNRNNGVRFVEINGNTQVCLSETHCNSNKTELEDINGNNVPGAAVVNKSNMQTGSPKTSRNDNIRSVQTNGHRDTRSPETGRHNQTRSEAITISNQNDACITSARKSGITAETSLKRKIRSQGNSISRRSEEESKGRPRCHKMLFSPHAGTGLQMHHKSVDDSTTTENGCSDTKKAKMTDKLRKTAMQPEEQKQPQFVGHNFYKDQTSSGCIGVNANTNSRWRSDDNETQHDGLSKETYETSGQRDLHDDKTRKTAEQTLNGIIGKEEETQSLSLKSHRSKEHNSI